MSNLPAIQEEITHRGIGTEVWSALKNSLFPGAADQSVLMAWDYCAARGLDVMLKPVHLVPMYIKDKNNGDKGQMRDVVMPGIGMYRIQADRSGNYAGMSAPVLGPEVTQVLDGVEITYPEWCEITARKIIGDRIVEFTAREYWIENYATAGRDTKKPNAMWQKRTIGQLIKCTEAQALRKAWPEIGQQPTAEEMEGKYSYEEKDITPGRAEKPEFYSEEDFKSLFPRWVKLIQSGKKSAEDVIATIQAKAPLTEKQKQDLREIKVNQPETAA